MTAVPTSMAEAAQAYRRLGWSVIPLRPHSKQPFLPWEAYQHQPADERQLEKWFGGWPDANIGIVTGGVSGIVVLDVDHGHGGEQSLAQWWRAHGPLPETAEAVTGGGGRHLYFAAPEQPLRNRVGMAPGLDLRADGGVIVAPPSIHPSSRRYVWRAGRAPWQIQPAPLPGWLIGLAGGDAARPGHPMPYWRALVREGVEEGRRNDTVASLTGHLLYRGVDPEVALELMLCWNRVRCRPPLDDEEVAQTVNSITRLHLRQDAEEGGG